MPAALSADLILDMHGAGAELDERARRAGDVEGARAEPGIDVDQQWQVADIGDAADIRKHIVEVRDTEVRHAERAGGNAAAGQVDRLVAHALRHQRVIRADRAGDLERPLLLQCLPEPLARAHLPSSDLTLSRSSCSSLSVASMRLRLNSL